jgi:hypothetical protein
MTSKGWRVTQETKPLTLPAIKSDAGIFQETLRGTVLKSINRIPVIIQESLLELDPF